MRTSCCQQTTWNPSAATNSASPSPMDQASSAHWMSITSCTASYVLPISLYPHHLLIHLSNTPSPPTEASLPIHQPRHLPARQHACWDRKQPPAQRPLPRFPAAVGHVPRRCRRHHVPVVTEQLGACGQCDASSVRELGEAGGVDEGKDGGYDEARVVGASDGRWVARCFWLNLYRDRWGFG